MPKKTPCPLKDADLRRLLRQRDGKHHPRAYTLRLLVQDAPELKPRRVEVSLHTNDEEQALKTARLLVQTLHCLGFHFSHKKDWKQNQRERMKKGFRAMPLFSWGQIFTPTEPPCNAQNGE